MMSSQRTRFHLAGRLRDLMVESRFEPGHHLREQQLAQMLGVSRTPIRSALTLLAEKGAVEAVRNKGFFLLLRSDQLNRLEIDDPLTPAQSVYGRIMQDRLAGRLDDEVSMAALAARYEADRPLVRKVMAELERDGLIARGPKRNWSFLPSIEDSGTQQASYDFRLLLEPGGLLMRSFHADKNALDRLRLQHLFFHDHPNLDESMNKQLFELDADFHETIAGFSRNTFLVQAVQNQNKLRRLLELASYVNRKRIRDWCKEHLAIIDHIQNDDPVGASRLMQRHLERAKTLGAARNGGDAK